jgi:hypothetical protein
MAQLFSMVALRQSQQTQLELSVDITVELSGRKKFRSRQNRDILSASITC